MGDSIAALFEISMYSTAGGETLAGAELFGKIGTVWYSHGPLNDGADIALTNTHGYRARVRHTPGVTDYAIGVNGTVTNAVTVQCRPITVIGG